MPSRSKTKSAPSKVGYRNPPVQAQFKKGQSGNPAGRSRRPRSLTEALLEDMRTQVADLRTDRDYWRQTSDRRRVEFETTRRPLPAPEQLEDMRNQVTDLCADRDYWRQTCDHWRVAFETAQRLLPAPVERGTTAVTSWRGVFGQLCSTWAAQLATAVTSWRGVFGQLCSTGAAQLATAVAS